MTWEQKWCVPLKVQEYLTVIISEFWIEKYPNTENYTIYNIRDEYLSTLLVCPRVVAVVVVETYNSCDHGCEIESGRN